MRLPATCNTVFIQRIARLGMLQSDPDNPVSSSWTCHKAPTIKLAGAFVLKNDFRETHQALGELDIVYLIHRLNFLSMYLRIAVSHASGWPFSLPNQVWRASRLLMGFQLKILPCLFRALPLSDAVHQFIP